AGAGSVLRRPVGHIDGPVRTRLDGRNTQGGRVGRGDAEALCCPVRLTRLTSKGGTNQMAKNPPEESPNIFPALRYKNGAAALEWLARAFGFEQQMVVPGPEGTIAHAQMKLGPGVIMLGSGKHGPGTDNPWDTVKQGVYVYVEDVDAHYARAKAAGAESVMEVEPGRFELTAFGALLRPGGPGSCVTWRCCSSTSPCGGRGAACSTACAPGRPRSITSSAWAPSPTSPATRRPPRSSTRP